MSFSVQLPTYQVETQTDVTLYPSHTEANNHYQKFVDKMFLVNYMRMENYKRNLNPIKRFYYEK
jgi:hypothetical protein